MGAKPVRTQVADFRKTSGAQARCGLCFSSAARPRQLTIAIGHTAYLALPAGCARAPMHACWQAHVRRPRRPAALWPASPVCMLSLGAAGVVAPMLPGRESCTTACRHTAQAPHVLLCAGLSRHQAS